jgi:catalase
VEVVRAALPLPELKYAEDPSGEEVVNSYGIVTAYKVSLLGEIKDALNFGKGEGGFLATFASELSKYRNWARETDGLITRVAF